MNPAPLSPYEKSGGFIGRYWAVLPVYYLSSLLVFLGAVFGQSYIVLGKHPDAKESGLVGQFSAWDGVHYVRIARDGYSYNPDAMSSIAFFPAFPLTGRLISSATGWPAELSLLISSHWFLLASFFVTAHYLQIRGANGASNEASTLIVFALFPTTFYFRMAYTESLFVLVFLVFLVGTQRDWPIWGLALIVGLATSVRAAGVALFLPLLWTWWQRSGTWGRFLGHSLWIFPLASWGLIGFMLFQFAVFGDPLAFAKTQLHWDQRPPTDLATKLFLELTLEPIWSQYDPASSCHQLHAGRDANPIFGMYFTNPIYFLAACALVCIGGWKGWLTRPEVVASASLLAFSYLTKSYHTCMCSQARYAASVFPIYIVMGHLLDRLPRQVSAVILGVFGLFMGLYSALFVRWHDLY